MAIKAFKDLIKTKPVVILHIEDSFIYAKQMQMAFRSENPNIKYHTMSNDKELGRIQDIDPDIAIVDYDLGDDCPIKGDQIVQMIKSRKQTVFVIANSADGGRNELMLKAGADIAIDKGNIVSTLFRSEENKKAWD